MFDPARHHRRSLRLPGHAYVGPCWYFITLLARHRLPIFGSLGHGEVRLSRAGWILQEEWQRTPDLRPGVAIDAFVVMPEQFHGLIWLPGDASPGPRIGLGRTRRTLGSVIAGLKASVCSRIRREGCLASWRVWHRDYYESILRTPGSLQRVRRYIISNPDRAGPGAP